MRDDNQPRKAAKDKNPNAKQYLTNANLIEQITLSHKLGEPTLELHKMFWLLAEKLSHHRYFHGYSFREDLPAEGYLGCLHAWNKFDLNQRFKDGVPQQINPFAYLTTSVMRRYYAYCIQEKEQADIKKALDEMTVKPMLRYSTDIETHFDINLPGFDSPIG